MRFMLKSKIHRATVTGADKDYEGSLTVDASLLEAADILPYEQVHVWDVTRGTRLLTYAIAGPRQTRSGWRRCVGGLWRCLRQRRRRSFDSPRRLGNHRHIRGDGRKSGPRPSTEDCAGR